MLEEFVKRRRAARTVEDAKLVTLKRELDKISIGQQRLYEAVEQGPLPMDDSLRMRSQKLKACREDLLMEMAKLKDRQQLNLPKLTQPKVDALCDALKACISDPTSGLGKAYLRLLVDKIRLEDNELKMRGSYHRLADAMGLMERMKLGEVPSFITEWRARQDSNPRSYSRCTAATHATVPVDPADAPNRCSLPWPPPPASPSLLDAAQCG
jgi:site-specific DNA recombinase